LIVVDRHPAYTDTLTLTTSRCRWQLADDW